MLRRRARVWALGFLGFSLLVILGSCEEATNPAREARAIESVLDERRVAMQARDVNALLALLSPDYRDKEGGYAQAKALIESAIGSAESLQVVNTERWVEVHGDRADSRQRYFLVAVYEGLTQTLKGREHLSWRRENGRWRITGGLTE